MLMLMLMMLMKGGTDKVQQTYLDIDESNITMDSNHLIHTQHGIRATTVIFASRPANSSRNLPQNTVG